MRGKKLKLWMAAIFSGIIILIIWHTATQPGINDLEVNFEKVAFYRNENNTGPVHRVYAVAVSDTNWIEMENYGEFMPHTKYGTTRVYFFMQGNPYPTALFPDPENFGPEFQAFCLAKYEKDAMGMVSFVKY